jgi:diketogulonate reductase-like aldo/keto reductase
MEAKNSFERQLAQAIDQSQEALQILTKLSSIDYASEDISECFKAELEGLTTEISLMISELKEASVKALTLCENVNSLMNAKKNLDKFNNSLERFKSFSTGAEKR